MNKKLNVLYVSAECEPYARTGGLGDVANALPEVLAKEGIKLIRVLPLYSSIKTSIKYKTDFSIIIGDRLETCIVKYDPCQKKVPTYFIGNDNYFNRENLYGYPDDSERFLFFCRSIIKMIDVLKLMPDIIHCNDWHTGLIPLIAKGKDLNYKTVYTIHNLKYQGWINSNLLTEDEQRIISYKDGINFMESGIIYSDYVTTVSEGYAHEILTPEMGEGMDNILKEKSSKLIGIMNGIDISSHRPEKEQEIYFPFDINNIQDKAKNKIALKKELGLNEDNSPLISAITRLSEQKGIKIMAEALNNMAMDGFQFVILGKGDKYYENIYKEMELKFPGKVVFKNEFDPVLAEKIYASSDMFLMPSRYEPGGLGQLYAMSYGTIPVVRHTGGLVDTVIDLKQGIDIANGFCFDEFSSVELEVSLKRALNTYNTPIWDAMIINCMSNDISWKNPSKKYIKLYKELVG